MNSILDGIGCKRKDILICFVVPFQPFYCAEITDWLVLGWKNKSIFNQCFDHIESEHSKHFSGFISFVMIFNLSDISLLDSY